MSKVFNALNGIELKKAILHTLEEQMDLSGEFRPHVTYPWVRFEAKLSVLSYPKQAMDAEPGIVLTATDELTTKGPVNGIVTAAPAEPELVLDLDLTKAIDTPDQTRVDSNQPIPTVSQGPNEIHVDKPVNPRGGVKSEPIKQFIPGAKATSEPVKQYIPPQPDSTNKAISPTSPSTPPASVK